MARQAGKVKYYTEMLEERNGELREVMAGQRQAEQEILRLNRALKTRVEALSELNAELEAFSFTVSHDLNGPLAHITSFSRALRDECGLVLGERGMVYLERIDSASQRMGQLIRDLLELARGSHCDIKFEMVDLSAIAGEIAGGLRAAGAGADGSMGDCGRGCGPRRPPVAHRGTAEPAGERLQVHPAG